MKITRGNAYPLGATLFQDGIQFTFVSKEKDCGVILFDKDTLTEKERIPFPQKYVVGDVHTMYITGLDKACIYCFYEKDIPVTDIRGKMFKGVHPYGVKDKTGTVLPATFLGDEYDWEGDSCPKLAYSESIGYCMHVRGFTIHDSSKVKHRGTFSGITEKILYLKELGVTTLELQPAYEFEEVEGSKINYWGYTKGLYYTPKSGYATKDAVTEFKDMIKALHKEGFEVIMQFYFTEETSKREISDILSFWVLEYHVDGFHLKGASIDAGMLMHEPALMDTKLWYYSFPVQSLLTTAQTNDKILKEKRLAFYTDDFFYDMRRFLKGDEGMISAVMYQMRNNPSGVGRINYLTNYDGLTMYDCVSYNDKHNEDNGENNRDGAEYNASWNCGAEGVTKKRHINALRKKQWKNGFLILMLSQGMPLFFMGDEFGNSQGGNNNPYCQDNETAWLNWEDRKRHFGKELFSFAKKVIALRKEHAVFSQPNELRMCDYIACGCPDISYHGEEAWKSDTDNESRQLGIMYCGAYAKGKDGGADFDFYIAYNMHWKEHVFALPRLPKGLLWEEFISSHEMSETEFGADGNTVKIPSRSILVLKSNCERKTGADESRTAF